MFDIYRPPNAIDQYTSSLLFLTFTWLRQECCYSWRHESTWCWLEYIVSRSQTIFFFCVGVGRKGSGELSISSPLAYPQILGIELRSFQNDINCTLERHSIRYLTMAFSISSILLELRKWLQEYLLHRLQCVRVSDSLSHFCAVRSGVPQRSVLGPLLFCYFY